MFHFRFTSYSKLLHFNLEKKSILTLFNSSPNSRKMKWNKGNYSLTYTKYSNHKPSKYALTPASNRKYNSIKWHHSQILNKGFSNDAYIVHIYSHTTVRSGYSTIQGNTTNQPRFQGLWLLYLVHVYGVISLVSFQI